MRGEILGNIALTQVSSSQLHFPFAFQSPWSRRPSMCADSRLLSVRMTLGKSGETARFTRRPEQTSRRALTAQGDLEREWNTRNWRTEAGINYRSDTPQSSARKKAARKKAESRTAAPEGGGQQVEIRETGLPLLRER